MGRMTETMGGSVESIASRIGGTVQELSEAPIATEAVEASQAPVVTAQYMAYTKPRVDTNVVANFIDIVARDLSEVMAPLPAVNCSSANQKVRR